MDPHIRDENNLSVSDITFPGEGFCEWILAVIRITGQALNFYRFRKQIYGIASVPSVLNLAGQSATPYTPGFLEISLSTKE